MMMSGVGRVCFETGHARGKPVVNWKQAATVNNPGIIELNYSCEVQDETQ